MKTHLHSRVVVNLWRSGVLAGLLAVWVSPVAAWAQDSGGVTLAAQAGFDGYCKDERWLPVRAVLENSGSDLDGQVEVRLPRADGGESVFAYPLNLPTTSRKEVLLNVYPETHPRDLDISFNVAGKQVAQAKVTLTCVAEDSLLYGVLASSPSAYTVLSEVRPPNSTAAVAQLQPADLPDQSAALESLDALVVSDVDTGVLSDLQRQALAGWLAGGGRLVVAGGAGWQKTAAGLSAWLPLIPETTQTLPDLAAVQTYASSSHDLTGSAVVVTGRLVEGAEVLSSEAGVPLVARRRFGFGAVYYLAADPAFEPFNGWQGASDLYRSLLLSPGDRPGWASGFHEWYAAQSAVTTLPNLELPSASLICAFLGLYVIAVGPLNYIALRVLKRRELAWLSVPGLAIAFGSAAFLLGSQARGNQAILSRLSIVQVWPGAAQAQVDTLVGVFSPYRAAYQLQFAPGVLARPLPADYRNASAGESWTLLQQADAMRVPDLRMEVGGIRGLVAEGQVPAPAFSHDLAIDFNSQGTMLQGSLTNNSALALQDAILLGPGTAQRLGSFEPGEIQSVQVALQVASSNQPAQSGSGYPGDSTIGDILGNVPFFQDKDISRRYNLIQAAMSPSTYNYSSGRGAGFYLAGWTDTSPVAVTLPGQSPNTSDATLYLITLLPRVSAAENRVEIPPGLFTWSVIEAASDGNASAYNGRLFRDSYTLRFNVAQPLRFSSVEALTLHLESYGDTGPVIATLALWDFAAGDWTTLSGLRWGDNLVPDPQRYVTAGGEIRLRLSSTNPNGVDIELSDFTLAVRQ
ncbi:MAG TPA: hypothetical protein VJG32_14490 [Anaerolineae bacterium]|nr:hypothetical protein [Anaerolineae bacterium]